MPKKLLRVLVLLTVSIAGLAISTSAATASGPIFTVMNTSETPPDGVWFRNSPHTADTDRVTGHGVYMNERVQSQCYAWGDAVGAYNNRLWYFVLNVTRPTNAGVTNQGYLNAHYINDGLAANQIEAGVGQCGAPSPTPTPVPTPVPTPRFQSITNSTWSGYMVSGGKFTYVHGSWTVPSVSCSSLNLDSLAGFWVGIDGFGVPSLLQAGSDATCLFGAPAATYSVWMEVISNRMNLVAPWPRTPVKPGDRIQVDIRYHPGTKNYVVALTVNGALSFSRTGTLPTAQFASAECIAEGPIRSGVNAPLANFGTVTFSSCRAATNYAATGPELGAGSHDGLTVTRIDMASPGKPTRAVTGVGPSGGAPWSIFWRASGPA